MSKNIIYTVEAKIKDGKREAFDKVMSELIEATQKEKGALNYEWSIGEDSSSVHGKKMPRIERGIDEIEQENNQAFRFLRRAKPKPSIPRPISARLDGSGTEAAPSTVISEIE